ncbi:MAG: hypothetical protein OEZ34_09630 [Spirochaetia bacterium]|nr:hypothetical protein [Spirochaetia bacterium]
MNALVQGINPELNDMVRRGQLSGSKLSALYDLKVIVEKFAKSSFVSEQECNELKKKYGAYPNIITWGDYFQTEVASRYFEFSDLEFQKIVDTVRFDIISSIIIFNGKHEEFFTSVDLEGMAVMGIPSEEWTDEQAETAHLHILMKYYKDMNLEFSEISESDNEWYELFSEKRAGNAG